MRIDTVKKTLGIRLPLIVLASAMPGLAQDKSADNMQILRDKLKVMRRVLVAPGT
jgi:hypothetical protein